MRLLPRSLFGRLMLILASGLVVAQLLSAAINLVERDSVLVRASGMQPAQRIADIVTLLDSLNPVERERIVGILNVPPLVVSLDRTPPSEDSEATGGTRAAMFSAVLRTALNDDRPIRVAISGTPPEWASLCLAARFSASFRSRTSTAPTTTALLWTPRPSPRVRPPTKHSSTSTGCSVPMQSRSGRTIPARSLCRI